MTVYNIEDNNVTLVSRYHNEKSNSSGLGKGLYNIKLYIMLLKKNIYIQDKLKK